MNTLACLGILLAAVTPSFVNHNKVPGNTPTMTNMQAWSATVATSSDVSGIIDEAVRTNYLCTVADAAEKYLKKGAYAGTQEIGGAFNLATLTHYGTLNVKEGPFGGGLLNVDATITGKKANLTNLEVGQNSYASNYSVAEGYRSSAYGKLSHAAGYLANATNHTAFVWQGTTNINPSTTETTDYYDHGKGTFNVNPSGGIAGFWIGETNLAAHVGNLAYTKADANAKFLPLSAGEDRRLTGDLYLDAYGIMGCGYLNLSTAQIESFGEDNSVVFTGFPSIESSTLIIDGSPVATSNMVNGIVPQFIDHTLPHFSNEVLAVGFGISSNDVAVIREMVGTIGNLPIGGGVATLGGLLMAIIASLKWLKSNKANTADLPIALTVYNTSPISTLDCVDGHAYTVSQAGTTSTTDITVKLPQVSNAVATAFQATFVNTSADYTLTLAFSPKGSETTIEFDGNDCGVVNKGSSAILSAMWNGTAWNLVWKNKAS